MSFILDALRKSDARRQQGGTPGLNSPEPPRPPRRRRSRILPLLAAVVAVFAVAATGVYLVRPDWLPQPDAGADSERQVSERQVPVGETDGPGEQVAKREQAADGRDRREPPSETTTAEDRASSPGSEEPAQEPRRNRREPIPASPERTVRREVPQRERESPPVPAENATAELERRIAEEARRRREEAPPKPTEEAADRGQPAESGPEPLPEREPAEPRPLNEGVAEYVRQWELPLSVRRNLPELDLSIHVFSPVEAERFVLINGERYVPGDAIGEAQIVDISRDGAIVDFRSHRFLLEPR